VDSRDRIFPQAATQQLRPHGRRAPRAGDEADLQVGPAQRRLQRVLIEVPHRGHDSIGIADRHIK
jgi:hypothetical protein